MKVEDFCPLKPVCPVCDTIVETHIKREGIVRGDDITLFPCRHSFMDTSQGIIKL